MEGKSGFSYDILLERILYRRIWNDPETLSHDDFHGPGIFPAKRLG